MKLCYKINIAILLITFTNLCSCQNLNYEIESNLKYLKDSIILKDTNIKTRVWMQPGSNHFNILVGNELYCFKEGKPELAENKFGRYAYEYYSIGNNYFFNDGSLPKYFVKINGDSILTYPIEPYYFMYDNHKYVMQLYSHNSFVKLKNNEIIVPLLFYDNLGVKNVSDYFLNANKNRLGHFRIINDSLKLYKLIDFFPRKSFFINEKRCLSFLPIMCQSKNNYFLVYDFLDSIFQYDWNGNFINTIGLPRKLNFKQYNNERDLTITQDAVSKSELIGHNNIRLFFNKDENQLVLMTVEGIKEDVDYLISPSRNDMNWFISIYDLSSKKWYKTLKFDFTHEFRNVMFYKKKIYVKRKSSSKLIFDIYDL